MKKSFLIAVLLAIGCVTTSQAVIISWSATTDENAKVGGGAYQYDLVKLVYVSNDTQPTTYAQVAASSTIPTTASGGALVGSWGTGAPKGVRERTTDDTAWQTSGRYYVVLFNAGVAVAVSTAYMNQANQYDAVTTDPMNPATGVFNAGGTDGKGWTPVPEPGTLALVGLGAAALVIRRRRMRK